jgi:hypothetical protein
VHVGSGKLAGAGLIPDLSSSTRCQTLADRSSARPRQRGRRHGRKSAR